MSHAALSGATLAVRLVDSLYTEAMLLADETRAYFDDAGRADREGLSPRVRVELACEALKATTRIMQVIGWLLIRKAVTAGELPESAGVRDNRRLGPAPALDPAVLMLLPEGARRLIAAGDDLYQRVQRIDDGIEAPLVPVASPALTLLHRLERSI